MSEEEKKEEEIYWKNNPKVFHVMKLKYAMLIGVLHGYAYAGKKGTPEYGVVYDKVGDEVSELFCDIVNCGYGNDSPTLQQLVDLGESWIQEVFPIEKEDKKDGVDAR